MEECTNRESVSVISDLIQGKELAWQLSNHLISSSFPSSHETNEFLIEKILRTYEKALTMLNCGPHVEQEIKSKTTSGNTMDSHCSSTIESPKSEVMDHEFQHKALFKKRWREQVKIRSNTGLEEGSLDDEYSWRKYGQKDILGAKFPRGYYRCAHRNGQGCLATKQIQRSDEDSTIIEVTYRGRHTCTQQAKHLKKKRPPKIKMDLEENQLHNDQKKMEQTREDKTISTFKAELDAKTEDLETKHDNDIFPWFCFPSPSIGLENEDNNMLSEITMMENHLMESLSPSDSESNPFGLSEYYHLGSFGLCQNNAQTNSESDITQTVSVLTSVTNSRILDLDILLHKGDFDIDFPFNTPEYFSSLN